MEILLDEMKYDVQQRKLGAILEEVSQQLSNKGMMVVAVELNGECLSGDTLLTHREDEVEPGQLKLQSADPKQEALAAIIEIIDQLEDVQALHQAAADAIQSDKPNITKENLSQAMTVWQNVHLTVASCMELFGAQMSIPGLEDNLNELSESLKSLIEGLKEGDLVAMADSLEYEWPEMTEKWRETLKKLVESLHDSE